MNTPRNVSFLLFLLHTRNCSIQFLSKGSLCNVTFDIIIEQAQLTVKTGGVFGGGVQENLFCTVPQGNWFIIIDAVVLEGIKRFSFVERVEGADKNNLVLF